MLNKVTKGLRPLGCTLSPIERRSHGARLACPGSAGEQASFRARDYSVSENLHDV